MLTSKGQGHVVTQVSLVAYEAMRLETNAMMLFPHFHISHTIFTPSGVINKKRRWPHMISNNLQGRSLDEISTWIITNCLIYHDLE